MKAYCKYHNEWHNVADFEKDEETGQVFAWCKVAMKEQGRSVDYPPLEERGFGVYHPNYASLRPGYVEVDKAGL